MNSNQMLPVGATLRGGDLTVERQLSSGGFGNTYVVHNRLGKVYAMKEFFIKGINVRADGEVTVTVPDNKTIFERQRAKFEKEARRLSKIGNDHIVRVYDLFYENGTVYYTMDFIDGESLADKLKRTNNPLPKEEVSKILCQVLEALSCLHSQEPPLLHLDLKPANIMQDKQGNVVLIDFGASKQKASDDGNETFSTSSAFAYTQGYAPIEQINGAMKDIGPWTDFYALGATLYNLLTNLSPKDVNIHEGEEGFNFSDNVSPKMRQLTVWMMSPNRKKRPQTVNEIRIRLDSQTPSTATEACTTDSASEETIIQDPPHPTDEHEKKPRKFSFTFLSWKKYLIAILCGLATVSLFSIFISLYMIFSPSAQVLDSDVVLRDTIIYSYRNSISELYGFEYRTGKEVSPCQWKDVRDFSEGLAAVQNEHKKWGFIDTTGELVIPCQWDWTYKFSEGLVRVSANDKLGYIDKLGKLIIPCQWEGAWEFSEGLARVKNSRGYYGYIDKSGNEIIPCHWCDAAVTFREGVARVKDSNGKWGLIDKTGEVLSRCQWKDIDWPSEGMSCVRNDDDKLGYIDSWGNLVIPCQWEDDFYVMYNGFHYGLAAVRDDKGKYGFIDKTGKLVIPCIWNDADGFSEGMAAVSDGHKYGFIDTTGKLIIPCQWESAWHFSEGLAAVGKKFLGQYGYIDKTGKVVIPCRWSDAEPFHDGLAKVQGPRKWWKVHEIGKCWWIDQKGRVVGEVKQD